MTRLEVGHKDDNKQALGNEGKDREIKQLQKQLNQNNKQVIEELRAQNQFYKQSIKELTNEVLSIKEEIGKLISNPLRIPDYEVQLENQKKSIDQQAQQISELKDKINICEKKLKSCEEKPVHSDCNDFADAPGIHTITPDQEGPFDVLCDSATASLEKIHRLTRAQPHELYVHMEGFDLDLISLGKSEGSATADRLQYHKHQKFTTFDRDNDNYTYLWQLRKRKQILWWLVVPFTAIDRHSFVKTI
ncbi:uncharacterized protein [Drosophila virilis]|uniref:uncharacterized protein n=1 Tax=Drosophila virilis TaxID=7244 RepID=UPI0038B3C412